MVSLATIGLKSSPGSYPPSDPSEGRASSWRSHLQAGPRTASAAPGPSELKQVLVPANFQRCRNFPEPIWAIGIRSRCGIRSGNSDTWAFDNSDKSGPNLRLLFCPNIRRKVFRTRSTSDRTRPADLRAEVRLKASEDHFIESGATTSFKRLILNELMTCICNTCA